MFGRTFYHGTLRKFVVVFGNMFNGIYVQRFNSSNERVQTLKIPISYGPKEKFLIRLAQDPNLDQDVAISLPRMGFEMIGLNYAANRKLPSSIKHSKVNRQDNSNLTTQRIPVPYDIQFTLSIFVKNADDGTQILEQILPYFQPEWTNSVRLQPELDLVYDVPVILNDVNVEDTYEGDFTARRALIWNLNFTMKGFMFGPISTTGVIRRSIIDLGNLDTTTALERVNSQPGLKADGTPTSNNALSVPISDIDADDDYGISTDINDV